MSNVRRRVNVIVRAIRYELWKESGRLLVLPAGGICRRSGSVPENFYCRARYFVSVTNEAHSLRGSRQAMIARIRSGSNDLQAMMGHYGL